MKRAFKTEIILTETQRQKINQTLGAWRYVYNLYLATAQNHYKETGSHLSGYDFSKWLNNVYVKERDAWIKDVSSKAVDYEWRPRIQKLLQRLGEISAL